MLDKVKNTMYNTSNIKISRTYISIIFYNNRLLSYNRSYTIKFKVAIYRKYSS